MNYTTCNSNNINCNSNSNLTYHNDSPFIIYQFFLTFYFLLYFSVLCLCDIDLLNIEEL
jgi:hypothetical protein